MIGSNLAYIVEMLVKATGKDECDIKKQLADQLDVNIKTFTSWITTKHTTHISRPHVAFIRRMVESILITPQLQKIEEAAFSIASSEFICFWLVCGVEVILLKDSARNEMLLNALKFHNDEIHKRLSDISMTIDSIQETKIINTSGNGIGQHKKKIFPHAMTSHLSGGICHSMLKLPLVIRSAIGPRVVGLLDMQNRLEKGVDGNFKPIQADLNSVEPLGFYSAEKVDELREMALTEYGKNLREIMEALDYLDPETSPGLVL